jgi:hypothetical protein
MTCEAKVHPDLTSVAPKLPYTARKAAMPSPSTPAVREPSATPARDVPTASGRARRTDEWRAAVQRSGGAALVSLRAAKWAVGGYLAARAVNLLVFALMALSSGKPFWSQVGAWDGEWFRDIADFGYVEKIPVSPTGRPYWVNVEFFPGYPYAVRFISTITGLNSLNAGMVVTLLSGAVAAWGLYALGRQLTGSHRTGTLFAVLWGVGPGAMVLSMVYSEALFMAFAAWALYALVKKHWMTAGVLAVFAGLTRNTGYALVAAIGVAALFVVLEKRPGGSRTGLFAPEARRPVLATLIAPIGCVGFLAWVGWMADRIDAWFWIQDKAFNLRFDFGVSTVQWMAKSLTQLGRPVYLMSTFIIIASVVLMIWSFRDRRVPLSVHTYTFAVMVLALTSSNGWFFQSKPRFMLPAVTLVLPLAVLMSKWPKALQVTALAAAAAFGGWYTGYLVYVINTNP